ncbi:MAG: hypothetical protein V2I63_00370 [Pseudomonadales bacterium]|jgi:hypothetical protein|nr:hypothetical protein [Pseudomonadales bacterium]
MSQTDGALRRVVVIILTSTYRIRGEVALAEGERITDYVTAARTFIAVTHAQVRTTEGALLFDAEFLNVHRDHIEVIAPETLTRGP